MKTRACSTSFGVVSEKEITLFSLYNTNDQCVKISNFGGIVHSWDCADKEGNMSDILLGCRDLSGYTERHPYFGAIIGRYANRIANGTFILDDKTYNLEKNLPPHHLHGGKSGFDRKIYDYSIEEAENSTTLKLHTKSAHMEEGYPGNLDVDVHYTFNDDNELVIEYFAQTDTPTVINLTNHCYFNLSGGIDENILDHEVKINADHYTEADSTSIPTGRILAVENSILDFRAYRLIRDRIYSKDKLIEYTKGFDHNFVINEHQLNTQVAAVRHHSSGRILEVYTDQPGIQLYTGNWLGSVEGKTGKYCDYAGLCLETQHFPDSPNHKNFPSTLLLPNDAFYSKTKYKVSTF